jgi:hypothetical protein
VPVPELGLEPVLVLGLEPVLVLGLEPVLEPGLGRAGRPAVGPAPAVGAAAVVAIGAATLLLVDGGGCDGAPKPGAGAVVVVVGSLVVHGELPPGPEHWAAVGAVVVVVDFFLPVLGFGHGAPGPVVVVVEFFWPDEPDLFLDFLADVAAGAADAGAAAL